jgi:hypothetical protein
MVKLDGALLVPIMGTIAAPMALARFDSRGCISLSGKGADQRPEPQ